MSCVTHYVGKYITSKANTGPREIPAHSELVFYNFLGY